uniref:E3 ubiquitin-protein ligase TRIM9-like isoform X1 n=1 Tax=Crassostrea virginica TaxID=6565 RepID=A0A8B8B230_CRAVI|nr:E3 ubiquitin-protein ligase TRIM9-like isoform X1 [Crassostrea virginica]
MAEPQTIEAAALYDFEGRKGRELSFKKHDTLLLYRRVSQDWWEGLFQGKKGLIPDRYITLKHPNQHKRMGNRVLDPRYCAQDVLRCHLCETPVPPLCCDPCHIYLCKVCAGEHILDESKNHKVVPIKQALGALIYPTCSDHSTKNCQLFCEVCTVPICVQCASSKEHRGHEFVDLLETVECIKEVSQKDVQELESSVLAKHEEISSDIRSQKEYLKKNLQESQTAVDEHCKKLVRKVSKIAENFKSEILEENEKELSALTEREEQTTLTISNIKKCILNANEIQASRDVGFVVNYKSRNEEFRSMLPKHNVSASTFFDYHIDEENLLQQFGFVTTQARISQSDETESFEPSPPTLRKAYLSYLLMESSQFTDKEGKRVKFLVENVKKEEDRAQEWKLLFATEKKRLFNPMHKLGDSEVKRKDIKIVMLLTNVSRSKAIIAIRKNLNDIVEAIKELRGKKNTEYTDIPKSLSDLFHP